MAVAEAVVEQQFIAIQHNFDQMECCQPRYFFITHGEDSLDILRLITSEV